MIATGQTFKNLRISLDGSIFKGCTFEACVLIFSGLLPISLENNSFDTACRWELRGPARETVMFMHALYRAGGKDLIEGIFNSIRSDGRPPAVAGNA